MLSLTLDCSELGLVVRRCGTQGERNHEQKQASELGQGIAENKRRDDGRPEASYNSDKHEIMFL